MATSSPTPEQQAEFENALRAEEDLAFRGTTNRRCLRCGGELRMIESGSGLQIRCEREQRVILTARA